MHVDVERLATQTGDLPAMPVVAQTVMALVQDENTTPADLQRVIAGDQAMAGKILKVANSALFSRTHAVSTLSHAILMLGFSTIRSLVMAASARSLFRSKRGDYGLKERLLWEHSLGCAFAARLLTEHLGLHGGMEAAFLGGLLHDIGKIVLNSNRAEEYQEIFQETYNERRAAAEVELERLGFTHADVGALVLRKWKFSEDLEDIIACHHDLPSARKDSPGAAIVHLANLMCEHLGIGQRPDERIDLLQSESAQLLKVEAADLSRLEKKFVELFEKEKQLFDP